MTNAPKILLNKSVILNYNPPYKTKNVVNAITDNYIISINQEYSAIETYYICEICEEPFTSYLGLFCHQRSSESDGKYECYICKRMYSCLGVLKNHLTIHDKPSSIKLETYDKNQHKSDFHTKLYQCNMCHIKLENQELKKHIKEFGHMNKYHCFSCPEQFAYKSLLRQHEIIVHSNDTLFQCSECQKSFKSKGNLRAHYKRMHFLLRPYKCNLCIKSFFSITDLKIHLNRHAMMVHRQSQCDICKWKFKNRATVRKHVLQVHVLSNKPVECELCRKVFIRKYDLERHKKSKHVIMNRTTCTVCNKVLSCTSALTKHMNIHNPETIFQCKLCGKSFNNAGNRSRHYEIHLNIKKYQCDICNKHFRQFGQLKDHMLCVHIKSRTLECDVCGKFYPSSSRLALHKRTHKIKGGQVTIGYIQNVYKICDVCGELKSPQHIATHINRICNIRPFQCQICFKQFLSYGSLYIHKKIHENKREYKCDECPKGFNQKSILNIHKRVHNGICPYKCSICPKSFKQGNHLKTHLVFHSRDKPYKCEFCPKTFGYNASKWEHKKIHHPDAEINKFEI